MEEIGGVIAAVLTPRQPNTNKIELGALFEVVDGLSGSGVSGVALFGTTGEFLHFDIEDRLRAIRLATKRCRVPVIVGVGHSTLDGALLLAREADRAGAAAALLMPPYFLRYSQQDIRAFYLEFVRESNSLPVIIYNIGAFNSNEVGQDLAAELLAEGSIAGIKDSTSDLETLLRLNALRPQHSFRLLVGNDTHFVAARRAGADGVVSGVASAVPELMVALDAALLAGAEQKVGVLESRLRQFLEQLDRAPVPVMIRTAALQRKVPVGPHGVPLSSETQQNVEEFAAWFREWLPAVLEECRSAG
jgi:dihydrodipicolinate synthase/N-acetylneuraminate lyase